MSQAAPSRTGKPRAWAPLAATDKKINELQKEAMNGGHIHMMMIAGAISLLVSAAVLVVGPQFVAKAQEAKRFQYRVVDVLHETDAMQRTLNDYGNAGWELVEVSAGDLTSPRMIFKK